MSKRLTGLNPLAYIGVEPVQPSNMFMKNFAPTATDARNVNIGDFWVDVPAQQLWVLASLAGGTATWILLEGASFGTTNNAILIGNASGGISSLPVALNGQLPIGNTGNPPTIATLTAGTGVTIVNGPGSITISAASAVSESFVTNSGTAIPVAGVLNVLGVNNIATSGSGNTVDISVSGTTNHSLQLGNSTGSLNSLGVATNGQLPIGSTGADPVLATITAGTGVTVTNGAGSITIAASGSVPITFDGNTGSATPSGGVINIVGTGGLTTSATGSTVTINGANVPQTTKLTLTSSQIKNLATTPITVITAPGANLAINVLRVDTFFSYGGTNAFVAGSVPTIALWFNTNTNGNQAGANFLGSATYTSTNSIYVLGVEANGNAATLAATGLVNQPIVVGLDSTSTNISGNAANDNTIHLVVSYEIINVTTYF